MQNKFLIPPGFKDSLSFDTFVEHQYKNLIINSFREYGFSLIKTPLIEFSSNLDSNTLSLKSKIKDPKLSIRNDITPQIIRVARSRLSKKIRPLKLCYYGEVVRKKGTILRPERQFQQVGAEIIGAQSYKADVEIINLAYQTLKNIGIKNIVIEISA
ncbi:ATP phosphoribosyltransferase regulatory subunit, partial [Pelagibacteraceae bacterium]|nr:ATP phosphoribosyltransferase regulatory subunit [Pelagibacteraceae bacterium]